VVSRPSYGSVGNQISRAMILHEVTFRDLWETIMVIEPAAAAVTARRRWRAWLVIFPWSASPHLLSSALE
jgi:hypothetical protein